ncbi:O-antigen ligase family protein [Bacteroides thetaiotaomicron]|jgi:hypothetical protein|uniref:Lipid A core-O-antigen ligase and related enzymes n=1 Tax=Bacteroides thetaiotaomicron TaxID=818 RepID=A0A174P685_BACT4|nr:O-antigen ligase family protein [Bacteroides thetaiotaomicron]MCS2645921.1 O-antigen ligase family protein [Bacteroides thetaiotaomicron]CUP53825.1 Lipid A core-O-antigen ligase and related enzymes [Bacteroides thetaiotaomicron]
MKVLNDSIILLVEKLLIIFSFVYLMTFLFYMPAYLNYVYILSLTILYSIYFYVSKIKLEISFITILSIVLLGYIYIAVVCADQLECKRYKLYTLVSLFILLQLNSLIFRKHYKFASKVFILTILLFYLFLSIKIIVSKSSIFFIIEQYFDNIGIFAIFISLSTVIILYRIKEFRFKYINWMCVLILLASSICVLLLKSRTAFIVLVSFLVFSKMKCIRLKKNKIVLMCFIGLFVLILAAFIKQNSSLGRLFIWKTSSYIVKDNLIFGIGYNNFAAVYPIYQATMYQTGKMSSKDMLLADNTKVALNEYIQIMAELGLVGLILFILFIAVYIHYNKENTCLYWCICIAMFFSYILHSAIICYMLILQLSLSSIPPIFKFDQIKSIIILFVLICFSLYSLDFCFHKINSTKVIQLLFTQSPDKLNTFYDINERYLCDNTKILFKLAEYNYEHNCIDKSLFFLYRLDDLIKNNELELLKGKCYVKNKCFDLAERHLLLSIAICPNRFVNRYELFNFYKNINMDSKATVIAKDICEMKEKVPSIHTLVIKKEMFNYLDSKIVR